MIIAKIVVSGFRATAVDYRVVPAGIIGAKVEFEFIGSQWDGLSKTAVFRGCTTRSVLMDGNTVTLPHEVVANPVANRLEIGVYGVDADETVAIPTLWATAGFIRDAADPSADPSADPQLPIWAQLQEQIEDLKQNGTGGAAASYDENTGELTITGASVAYDETTGELTI